MGFFDGLFKGSTSKSIEEKDEYKIKGEKVKVLEIGSSGTEIFAGQVQEEYLRELNGPDAADVFDKMRRSDPKIKMITNAMKNPIVAASWEIVGTEEDETELGERQRELIEHILFRDAGKTFDRFLREALSMIEFGFSLFEVTYKAEINHPKFGAYNGLKSIAFRSQRTIERWNIERSGKLGSVEQQAFGDKQKSVVIPAEYLLHFAIDMEGDNFEGISIIRPAYGPWLRKNEFLKMLAAGIEKYAIPIPVLSVPSGKENTPEYAKAREALRAYVSHRCNYLIKPDGWDLNLTTNTFDADKIRRVIDAENVEMVNAALANFLELGQSGSGSYALGTDLSDFFLGGLEYIADQISETINSVLIPKLVKLNFPDGVVRCELRHSGIRDKAGEELAKIVSTLVRSGIVQADDRLEKSLRKRFGLPEKDESTERENPTGGGSPSDLIFKEKKTDEIELSEDLKKKPSKREEGVSRLIEKDAEKLSTLFEKNLSSFQEAMIEKARKHFEKSSATGKLRLKIDDLLKVPGLNDYKRELENELASFYSGSLQKVQKEKPSLKFAEIDEIGTKGRARIKADVDNLVKVQVDDLAKAVSLQYGMSVESTDSPSQLSQDLKEASEKTKKQAISTGALIQASKVVNDARRDFFGEFKEEIVSFTWINDSPVAEICKHLQGRTIPADHPDVTRFWPPLHHNCKTYVIANTARTKDNPEPQNGFAPPKKALDSVTLAEIDIDLTPPKGAQENAKKVKDWIEKHGRDEVDGMTQTGLARMNQLIEGKPLTIETVRRIAQFNRHRKNSKISPEFKNEPWRDKGFVSWLGWGGTVGIDWAIRKVDEYERKMKG